MRRDGHYTARSGERRWRLDTSFQFLALLGSRAVSLFFALFFERLSVFGSGFSAQPFLFFLRGEGEV